MTSSSGSTSWLPWPSLPEKIAGHGRRTFFFVGIISGITLSLGSLATALILADIRAHRKRKKRFSKINKRSKDERSQHNHRADLIDIRAGSVVNGVSGLIGNTPLMRINSLSELTGCEILGKAEWLNPGGSPKDRVAKQILEDAEDEGLLHPNTGSCIFEGTVGSTGISLATLAKAKGYRCSIVIPDDVASEKMDLLRLLGAEIDAVRPRGIVDPRHFVNEARKRAEEFGKVELVGPHAYDEGSDAGIIPGWDGEKRDDLVVTTNAEISANTDEKTVDEMELKPRGFFADQFENISNFYAHYHGTGPEIWRQTGGIIDAFVAGAGTGGTLAGVAAYLKESVAKANQSGSDGSGSAFFGDQRERSIDIVLADPQGSGLFNRVKYGVMFNQTEAEGKRRRHQVDTVVEGIGLNRLTKNFGLGLDYYDDAVNVTDEEAVSMSRHLVLNDGLFLGSSSAVNCVASVKTALRIKREREKNGQLDEETPIVVVTILCDHGSRHLSKFWNDEALTKLDIKIDNDISTILE
ncbi:PALP-domain-containing protein [Meira miltonrushii]|uniref:cysteine synthase n=1 Tax=Meira miltonrushii TaxID=1280837 RepID=A0A316VM10_9BASI|nr:PALP-domain-containing protein [Meira miltonrushii]PWN38324.1 PALP-domain-containing protein [Meira miltonrushii]